MRRPFIVFVLAALPLSAAVHRHGVPHPVEAQVTGKDDHSVTLEWLAPIDPKPELGQDANGDDIVGPVTSYEVHLTSVPPPAPGPFEAPWWMESNGFGESNLAWAESVPLVDGAPVPADPGVPQGMTIAGLGSSCTFYIFIVDFDENGLSSYSPLIEVTTDATPAATPAPTLPPFIEGTGDAATSGGLCSASCGGSAWVVAALIAILSCRFRS